MAIRNYCYDKGYFKSARFETPVICVGNITVGGTGKTPHTEYIVRLLQEQGKSVAVLSRGYGRNTKGFLWVEKNASAKDVGDEPLQIKQKFNDLQVAVCEQRADGIAQLLATDHAPDVIVLDDAFQHRAVEAKAYILLVDYNRPLKKDLPFPAGRLREFASGKKRADIMIYTKCPKDLSEDEKARLVSELKPMASQSVYMSTMDYQLMYSLDGKETRSLADFDAAIMLTGIAQPAPFRNYLLSKLELTDELCFADHHNYTAADIKHIEASCEKQAAVLITTEKDASRLQSLELSEKLRKKIYYIPIEVKFLPLANQEQSFDKKLLSYVTTN